MSDDTRTGTLPGKRYRCETCGGELICTKPGSGGLTCCDAPMTEQEPKPMPSAD